jgi:septal ring factor EnvC (AmiA/AmiB activator)
VAARLREVAEETAMATIDDVHRKVTMLLDALVRMPPYGLTEGMGQVGSFPGLVPTTHRAAFQAREASAEALNTVNEVAALLNAVNNVTLGRVETEIKDIERTVGRTETSINESRASHDQALARIEAVLKDVMQFLPTLRADMTDLAAKLDAVVSEQQEGMASLDAKLDAVRAEVQALPH